MLGKHALIVYVHHHDDLTGRSDRKMVGAQSVLNTLFNAAVHTATGVRSVHAL